MENKNPLYSVESRPIESIVNKSIKVNSNKENKRKTPFLTTDLGCIALLGIVGAGSAATFGVAYNFMDNDMFIGLTTILGCGLTSGVCDLALRYSIKKQEHQENQSY